MKLLDIILEDENSSLGEGYNVVTKESFLNNMKEIFPYKGGCLYDFPNLEDFRKIATVNKPIIATILHPKINRNSSAAIWNGFCQSRSIVCALSRGIKRIDLNLSVYANYAF
jgi:hypothetical protein